MVEINPDPYKAGDPLGPTGRVTAIFNSLVDLNATLTGLKNAGFSSVDTAVFIGVEGSKQIDGGGEIRHIEGLKIFQNAVCDEGQLFDEFEHALQSGGAVVAVVIEDDETKKKSLVALLKSHNARKINYWGKWHYEGLG